MPCFGDVPTIMLMSKLSRGRRWGRQGSYREHLYIAGLANYPDCRGLRLYRFSFPATLWRVREEEGRDRETDKVWARQRLRGGETGLTLARMRLRPNNLLSLKCHGQQRMVVVVPGGGQVAKQNNTYTRQSVTHVRPLRAPRQTDIRYFCFNPSVKKKKT